MACLNPQCYFVPLKGRPRHISTVDEPVSVIAGLGKVVYLPCGNCIPCRRERRQDYTCLQLLESLEYDDNWFITLTYDEEHLPSDNSLHREHLSQFFESLRKYCKYHGLPCRYFAVGEYGDRKHRPHYHFSLFGLSPKDLGLQEDDSTRFRADALLRGRFAKIKEGVYDENGNRYWHSKVIGDRWCYGHHQIYRANRATFQYVAGYVTKKLSGPALHAFKDTGRLPPFALQSRPSIGYPWWLKHYNRLSVYFNDPYNGETLVNDSIEVPGMSWRIPRIMQRWFEKREGRLALEKLKRVRRQQCDPLPDRDDLARKKIFEEHRALRYSQTIHRKEV